MIALLNPEVKGKLIWDLPGEDKDPACEVLEAGVPCGRPAKHLVRGVCSCMRGHPCLMCEDCYTLFMTKKWECVECHSPIKWEVLPWG
jgi:hypothetical protein